MNEQELLDHIAAERWKSEATRHLLAIVTGWEPQETVERMTEEEFQLYGHAMQVVVEQLRNARAKWLRDHDHLCPTCGVKPRGPNPIGLCAVCEEAGC
jgi:hypothetical protein